MEIFITSVKQNTCQWREEGKPLLVVITWTTNYAICHASHQSGEYGTRPFKGVRAQDRSLDTLGGSRNASDPVGILLKRGASGAKQYT